MWLLLKCLERVLGAVWKRSGLWAGKAFESCKSILGHSDRKLEDEMGWDIQIMEAWLRKFQRRRTGRCGGQMRSSVSHEHVWLR